MIEPTDETLRRWLLHRLPAGEAEALEQRLLTDEVFGERLRGEETDLLDDYVRGDLATDDSDAAAARFAATARDRLRVRVAMAIARITRRSRGGPDGARHRRHSALEAGDRSRRRVRVRRTAALGIAASACALIVAVIGLNLTGLNVIGLNRRAATSLEPRTGEETTITLLADTQRGANVQTIVLPSSASTVHLQAEVDGNVAHARYTLSIDDAGRTAYSADGIGVREVGPYRFVEVVFDAHKLVAGSHRVRVVAEGSTEPAATWTLETKGE
jgi:hypothetical protein